MEGKNCSSLFEMIKILNDNVASILSGYELIVNVVNNHEMEISKLNSLNETLRKLNSVNNHLNTSQSKTQEFLTQSTCISVAANVDILSISNVDDNDILNQSLVNQSSVIQSSVNKSISPPATPKPDMTNPLVLETLSDISEILSETEIEDDDMSLNTEQSGSESSGSTSIIPENDAVNDIMNCNFDHLPYETHDSQAFNLFEAEKLDDSTTYSHFFRNRSTAYYGFYPYSYSRTVHPPRDFTENPYLQKVLSYAEIVYPSLRFNSAMINRYESGDNFIPHHSDNEEEIADDSLIVTISLGESRPFQFKEKGESGCNAVIKLNHGDSLVMSKTSQKYFTHGVPRDESKGLRLSITLRLISPHKEKADVESKESSTQTMETETPRIEVCPETIMTTPGNSCELIESVDPLDHRNVGYQPQEFTRSQMPDPLPSRPFRSQFHYDSWKDESMQHPPKMLLQPDTLYISSSMFRHLDPTRLSTEHQTAQVLFYPGADAL